MRPEPLCDLSGSVVKLDQERITTLRQEDTGQVQKRRTCKYAPQLSNPGYLRGNPGFGLIDLYQALASYFHLPPEKYFLWTRADDILHILIGAALVIIGCYGILKRERRTL